MRHRYLVEGPTGGGDLVEGLAGGGEGAGGVGQDPVHLLGHPVGWGGICHSLLCGLRTWHKHQAIAGQHNPRPS